MRHRTTALLAAAALVGGLVLTTATAATAAAAPRPASTHALAGGVRPMDGCDEQDPTCGCECDGLLGCLLDIDGGLDIGIHLG
jgi:hypothetical protein